MTETTGAQTRTSPGSHYHLIDTTVGDPRAYQDDVFASRRQAVSAARTRAEWLAKVVGLRVEALVGSGRYLVTTDRPNDAGRMIEVEKCEDLECLEVELDSQPLSDRPSPGTASLSQRRIQ